MRSFEIYAGFCKACRELRSKGHPCKEKGRRGNGASGSSSRDKGADLIEFLIDPEEVVYPMVKPNGTLQEMLMDC